MYTWISMLFSSTFPMYDISKTNTSVSIVRIRIYIVETETCVSNSEQEDGELKDVFLYVAIII